MAQHRRFTEEEMTSDPPLEKPKITTEIAEEEEKGPASKSWFDRHANARVPLIALEKDTYTIESQSWACFSIIKPEEYGKLKHGDNEYHSQLIKFRGAFKTRKEAEAHIHRLMKADPHFDIHLIPSFQWSSIDDDNLEDREYANGVIGEVLQGYFKNENNRMMGIRGRIENTEDPSIIRSEEATRFFEQCQRESAGKQQLLTHGDDDAAGFGEEDSLTMTLDQLAAQHGITPGASCAVHENTLTKEQQDAVVSSVILDEAK